VARLAIARRTLRRTTLKTPVITHATSAPNGTMNLACHSSANVRGGPLAYPFGGGGGGGHRSGPCESVGEDSIHIRNEDVRDLPPSGSPQFIPRNSWEMTAAIASGSRFPDIFLGFFGFFFLFLPIHMKRSKRSSRGAPCVRSLLRSPHIPKRHLYLPAKYTSTGACSPIRADLHAKFRAGALNIGSRAIRRPHGRIAVAGDCRLHPGASPRVLYGFRG